MIKKLSKLLLSLLMVLTVLDLSGLSVKAEDNITVESVTFKKLNYYTHPGESLQLEYLVNGQDGISLDVEFRKAWTWNEKYNVTSDGIFTASESGSFDVELVYQDFVDSIRVYVVGDGYSIITAYAGDGYFVRYNQNYYGTKTEYTDYNSNGRLIRDILGNSNFEVDNIDDHLTLSGWYYDPEFTRPVKQNDKLLEDITVYAKYDEAYLVTAHYNEGYCYGHSYDENTHIAKYKVLKGNPVGGKISYVDYDGDEKIGFDAWYLEEDYSGTPYYSGTYNDDDIRYYTPTSDIDLYARFIPLSTITFDYNGGYWLDGSERKTTYTYSAVPNGKNTINLWWANTPLHENPNLAFSHWVFEDGTEVTSEYKPTGDITVYAAWDEAYTVRFHVDPDKGYFYENGETSQIERKVAKGKRIEDSPYPYSKEGYGFIGWYSDSEYQNRIDSVYNIIPSSDMDIYARMSPQITITYDANGGYYNNDVNTTTYTYTYLIDSESSMDSYPYTDNLDERKYNAGYSYDREGKNPVDFTNFYPQENMTLYAMWSEAVYVTFHMMEGTYYGQNEEIAKYEKGSNLNIGYSSYRPTREGYVFDKWYLTPERDGQGYDYYELNNIYQELNEDVHLYAGYKKQYKLTFDANGEVFTNKKTQKETLMTEGSVVSHNSSYIPKGRDFLNPSKVFAGWYDNPECTGEKETFIDYVLDSDKTYYAKWEDEYYTITFHGMGGTSDSQTEIVRKYLKNSFVDETLPSFYKPGYARGDWYYDEELTQKADIVSGNELILNIDRDYDLYLSYLPYYKVYVDSNGGEFSNSYNQGQTVVSYTDITEGSLMYEISKTFMQNEVDGKVFAGYSLRPDGEVNDYVGKPITEDVTLYAIYTEDYATVTLRTEYGGYYNNATGKYDKEKTYKVAKGTELRHSQYIGNVSGPTERYEVIYKTKKGEIKEAGNALYNYVVEEDEVINAEFTFFDTVKVRFHGNGGISSYGEEVEERTTIRGKRYDYDFYYDTYFYYPDNSRAFVRFTYDQEGTRPVRAWDIINEDTDLYAQWTDEVWTITYDFNGGYSDGGKSKEVEKVIKGKNTSYQYIYNGGSLGQAIGWFTEPEGGELRATQNGIYSPTKDETVYAHFEKEIVTLTLDAGNGYFNSNINNKVVTRRFAKGALDNIGYQPTHPEGFEFVGFYDNPQFTGDKYGYQITLYNDLTLYAKFNEVIIPVESVVINKDDLTLKETQSSKLTATVYPDNANNKKLIWSSSDDSVATVSSTGLVTAVAPGTATITATSEYDNSIKDSITVTVLETPTYTVKFDGAGGTSFDDQVLLEGEKATNPGTPTREGYVFSGWYLGEEEYNFENEVTSNITIIAKWTEEDEVVYVNEIKFDGDINEATIKVGEEYFIVAYPHPANATDRTITYTSEDTSKAKVDTNGKVTGVSEGTTKIVLTSGDGNVTAKFTIHVVNIPDSLETDVLVVKPEEMELKQGSTGSLTAYPPSDAINQEVVWESEDSSIATVDKNGKVSAHKAGTVNIKVKLKDADLNALNEAVTYAENEYAAAEEALKEAEEVEEAARQLAENKDTIYRSAKSDEESAIANNEDAKQAYEAAVAKKPAAQKRVEDANEAVAEAEKAYERGEERLAQAAQSVEDAEEKVAQAQAAIDEGSLGFFRHYGATEAIKIIEDRVTNQVGNNGWGHTNVGANGDATSLENMKTAINFIAVGNELIANDDIQVQHNYAILKVTDRAMAVAQVQTNASSTNINHSQMNKYGENLAWGNRSKEYGGYDGWYFKEKRVYDWIVANGLNRNPSSWTEEQRRQCIKDCGLSSVSDIQVGHYINLVARGYLTTGYAINNVPRSNPYGETQGQVFGQENWSPDVLTPSSIYCPGRDCTFDPQYTVEEYKDRFNAYYDVIMGAFETAQAELDAALAYKERLSETNGLTDEEWQILTEAEKEAEEASQALSEIESEILISESDYKQTQHSLELAKKEVASALAEKEEADAAYLVAQQDVENKALDKAQKSRALETAKHNLKRVQATAKVTVISTIEKVEVDKTKLELKVGESSKVTATITPSDATNKNVTWISSNPDYVTVDGEGNITAIKRTKDNEPIKVVVRTEEGLKEAEVEVTVIQPVTGVAIDKTKVTLEINENHKLTATVLPEDANNQEVTWSSDKTNVVTVDQNGNIKAVGVGTATITVATKDSNKTATAAITVNPISINIAEVSELSEKTYTGEAITQSFTVTFDGKPLTEGTDYTVSYSNNINVGTANVTIKGEGNYTGKVNKTFEITPIKVDIPTAKTGLVYNGKSQTGVTTGDKYTLTGNTGTDAGSYTAVAALKDKQNYVWSDDTTEDKNVTWNIAKASIDKATVSAIANQTFTGEEIKPTLTVTLNGMALVAGKDYELDYVNNINEGTATVIIKGKGNYTGILENTFIITSEVDIKDAEVSGLKDTKYTGKAITQKPTVKLNDVTLVEGKDYTLTYKNNTNVGTATVTITGNGNYVGTKTATFKINANTKIKLNKTSATIGTKNVGKYKNKTSVQLSATVTGHNNTKVTWTSSNTKIAKVDKNGKVTAISDPNYKGSTVTITAKTVDGKKATCKVTVEDPINAFVRRLYKYCLNRNPDKGGFDYWTSRLRSKKITAAEAVKGFFDSKEMKDMKLSNAETIERCYLVMMDRKSDKGGKEYWLKNYAKYGKTYVLRGFVDSKEFTQICKDFNITRGTIK